MANGNGAPFYEDVTVTMQDGSQFTAKVQLTPPGHLQQVVAGYRANGWTVDLGDFYDSTGNPVVLGMGNGGGTGGNATAPGPAPPPIINPPGNGGNGSTGPSPQPGTTPAGQGGFDDSTSFAMLFAAFSTLGGIVSRSRKKKKR